MHRLQTSSGLDLGSLDITTTDVTFKKNMAYATVAFHPKTDPAINDAMLMRYTLEDRDGKWVVLSVAGAHGQGSGGHSPANGGGSELPPGHPPLPDTNSPHAMSSSPHSTGGQTQ